MSELMLAILDLSRQCLGGIKLSCTPPADLVQHLTHSLRSLHLPCRVGPKAEACLFVGVMFYNDSVEEVVHKGGKSIVRCKDGTQIDANLVLDATGHARRLVEYDKPFKPGYQVAA